MFERTVEVGDYVIRQGDDGDNFYVIDSGVFNIYVDGGSADGAVDGARQVGRYDGCGSFGELALMYNMPRAATIQVTLITLIGLVAVTPAGCTSTVHATIIKMSSVALWNFLFRPCRRVRCGPWTAPRSGGSS